MSPQIVRSTQDSVMYTDRASSCSTGEPMLQPDADRSPSTCSPCYSLREASWVYKTAVRHVNAPSFSIQDPPNCMLQWVPCALLYHMPNCRRHSRLKTLPKGEKLHGLYTAAYRYNQCAERDSIAQQGSFQTAVKPQQAWKLHSQAGLHRQTCCSVCMQPLYSLCSADTTLC
jgi:hypothetical protein